MILSISPFGEVADVKLATMACSNCRQEWVSNVAAVPKYCPFCGDSVADIVRPVIFPLNSEGLRRIS